MKITKLNYRLYARKSSEADDKQVLSNESQVSELKKLAKNRTEKIELRDEEIVQEAHSAKTAYTRPIFEQLVKDIEQGRIQGIVTWHPNRLSRNAVDAARLIELMDKGKLVEIVTPSQTYRDTPQDKFFFLMLTGQAKMENDSKGIDVKRGLRKKNEQGFPSGIAKPGYMNDYGIKGQRKIMVDPERFGLMKQVFDLFLSGKYSVRKLMKHADEVLGLRTIQRKKEGGRPVVLSRMYTILQDSFYAGFFYGKDENGETTRYEVNETLPRVITEEQYWQIQTMLGRKGAPRPQINKRLFPYTGRVKCGTCGGAITAEHKYQLICPECKHKFAYQNRTECPICETKITEMEGGTYLHYIFYHCTKKRDPNCPEGSVQEKVIDQSMIEYAENGFAASKTLSEWCIRHLDELADNDKQNEYERKATWEREKVGKQNEYDELVRMKMKGLIDDDMEFLRIKATLKADIQRIEKVLADMGSMGISNFEEVKKTFALAIGIAETFRSGTFEEKQEALSALGSNLTLKDKKLSITNKELVSIITNGFLQARALNEAFEPEKSEADKDETDTFVSVRPTLLRG